MSTETGGPALVVEALRKSFGGLEVLRGVGLSLAEHEVVCLIGASGSGKSTLLRSVNLLEPVDSGRIVLHGEELTAPGVYDYYCMPHEAAGMVGRIVVRDVRGPGAEPFDYWVGKPGTDGWREVPAAARAAFPSAERILAERRVHPPLLER